MALNKKGFAFLYALMLGTLLFILGMALAPAIVEIVGEQMTSLSCSTATNDWIKSACVQIDLYAPVFVALIFGLAGTIIGGNLA